MELLVDFRERDLIKLLGTFASVCNLPVGDFVIKKDNLVMYIIERKTLSDLAASIVDNRLREQRARLLESVDSPSQIVYIIEHNVASHSLPKSTLDGAILNLIFKHKLNVMFTNGVQDTYEKVVLLYKKVKSGELLTTGSTCELVSKKSKTMGNVYTSQLCVVPGVSVHVAEAIKKAFPCMYDLVTAFKNGGELILKDISVTPKRKIGPSVSKKVYACLM